MDAQMLKTGTVPVADQLDRLPAAANGESKFTSFPSYQKQICFILTLF
jgi:charged multivesicular body protein 4